MPESVPLNLGNFIVYNNYMRKGKNSEGEGSSSSAIAREGSQKEGKFDNRNNNVWTLAE